MTKEELAAIIEGEVSASIGGSGAGGVSSPSSSDLATQRAEELKYYNSEPLGNEVKGESQVVSSDVFDAVEGMLPQLIKKFTSSDDAVEFEPEGTEDEEAAAQRTDLCNYVFYRQNKGFIVLYEWFKDALLQKNGIVKYWWEKKEDKTEESYQGLTDQEYVKIVDTDGVEVTAHTAYDDPAAVQQKEAMLAHLGQAQDPRAAMVLPQIEAMPIPQLHDLEFTATKDASKICIEVVPPEEFGITAKQRCVSIQDTSFCYHRKKMTISELREMDCPDSVLDEIGGDDSPDSKPEVLARNRFTDEGNNSESQDPAMREVWVTECFIKLDYDGDGIAELRHIIMPSRTPWINEVAEHINFAAITPIIMPHRFIGKSIAEVVMDIQYLNSVIWRQMLNNLYLTNIPRKAVLSSSSGVAQANLDDLLDSSARILREYTPGAIREIDTPFVANAAFPMLEYMQGVKENRTGVTRYNQGTDADSLNKTARGISLIQNASQEKIDLIARIFAETGVKDLFRGIAYLLSKYSSKKMAIRLRGKWVDIDPRDWKTQYDMTVNVGLGTGNKDAQLVHLDRMHQQQVALMQEGRGYMVTDQNIYNLNKKMSENMGFKHPELFITDPEHVQKPPPQPNPEMVKVQQAHAEVQAKIQSNEKIRQFDAQTQKELEGIKAQALVAIKNMEIQAARELEAMRLQAAQNMEILKAQIAAQPKPQETDPLALAKAEKDAEVAIYNAQLGAVTQLEKTKEDNATKITVAQISANTALKTSTMQAETAAKQPAAAPQTTQPQQPDSSVADLKKDLAELRSSFGRKRVHKVKKLDDGGYEIVSQQEQTIQ